MTTPALFDAALRRRRRARAAASGAFDAADFLHRAAAAGFAERLEAVARPLPEALVLAAANGAYAEAVAGRFGIRQVAQCEAAPALASRIGAVAPEVAAMRAREIGGFDLLLYGLELHAVDDPIGALIQARGLLKPDGLLLAALFGGETLSELRAAWAAAEIEVSGGLSPRVAPMTETRAAGALLQRAGFALPVADSDRLEIWYADPVSAMREIRAMGESNALVDRLRLPIPRRLLLRAAEIYAETAGRADGKVRATVEILTLTGWAPAPEQPQPLRPGSARARLADALGVAERSAGERAPGGPAAED